METFMTLLLVIQENSPAWQALLYSLRVEQGVRIVGIVQNAAEAREFIAQNAPDVVLTGIEKDVTGGIELTEWIKRLYPQVKTMMVMSHTNRMQVLAALTSGAEGYASSKTEPANIIQMMKCVFEGQICLDPYIARHIRDVFQNSV